MATKTLVRASDVEAFMAEADFPHLSIGKRPGAWSASCYWPSGDILKDTHCCGHGGTVAEAMEKMAAKVEQAKAEVKKLKTAAECKAAVIDLIRQHDAAPASFRDAVDALPVSDR